MKTIFFACFLFSSFCACCQEDTSIITKAFALINTPEMRQRISDSLYPAVSRSNAKGFKEYQSQKRFKHETDSIFRHSLFIACTTYFVFDSVKRKTSPDPPGVHIGPKLSFHTGSYISAVISNKRKFSAKHCAFFFIDDTHFEILTNQIGSFGSECLLEYEGFSVEWQSSYCFKFILNTEKKLELEKIIHSDY
ncbi:MAG: hypothetical protein ABJA78_11385 [Ferruginibacter sp.]